MNGYKIKVSLRYFGGVSENHKLNEFVINELAGEVFSQRKQYISYRLFSGECEPGKLEEILLNLGDVLRENKHVFILEEGGHIEFFVGLFLRGNAGFTMSTKLMEIYGDLGIPFSFDIYPE